MNERELIGCGILQDIEFHSLATCLIKYEIAKELEISFLTAKAHLKKLVEDNIIIEDETDGTYQEI